MRRRGPARAVAFGLVTFSSIGYRPDAPAALPIVEPPPGGPQPGDLHARARAVDHYVANYGAWTPNDIEIAKRQQLVIVNPGAPRLDRAGIREIQAGMDAQNRSDDVLVLCYVSVGEDLRTRALTDDQIRADPRFRGDGSGPRIDPRGATADGGSLAAVDPRRAPSNGGTGFASYYLDDNDVHNRPNHLGDGFPDRNAIFGGLFVNAGDPRWFETLDAMREDGPDRRSGLRELLTADYGRGYGCDGAFLDTIDTAAPNAYTNASSANQTEYEWTAPGFGTFIRRVHEAYPAKLLLQNRGLFFFDPRKPQYAFNARGAIDFILFESYRLNSNDYEEWDPIHYADNRYNVAPKLMAEANRPDGFRVLSLGYAEGPADQMSADALVGGSTRGLDSLLEDIHVAQDLAGFRHYLTDRSVTLVNDFVRMHAVLDDDHEPPQWTSTYNDRGSYPADEPTPRIGIQSAAGRDGNITVRWDVALDQHRVRYVLYAMQAPFDFNADPGLTRARRVDLEPRLPAEYLADGPGPDRYPYEATVSGFTRGQRQYLIVRAVDESAAANEDQNTMTLTTTP
jgi:hypothetical protein